MSEDLFLWTWSSCALYSGDNMMPASNLAAGRDESTSTRSPGEEKSVTRRLVEKLSAPQECFSFKSIFSNVNITTSFLLVRIFQEKVSLFHLFFQLVLVLMQVLVVHVISNMQLYVIASDPKSPSVT